MIRITSDSLKGYILEEVLAYLIRHTGYRLLVDPSQDQDELIRGGNGILVKGRGGNHQVDVLGELQWIPAFTFPLRLFVEAKFREGKTGIDAIRNAIAILLDINDKNSGEDPSSALRKYYRYVYALFSASGFSRNAARMALAHQISLIDLSDNEFDNIRIKIAQTSNTIISYINNNYPEFESRGHLVSSVRNALREELRTWPPEVESLYNDSIPRLKQLLVGVVEETKVYSELFVGMAKGPFMLLMKAENPQRFIEYATRYPRHRINISWSPSFNEGRTWFINPVDDTEVYRLQFRLPETLSRWIFTDSKRTRRRALTAKQAYFSDITIYRHIEGRDLLYRLEYDPERTSQIY